MNLNGYRFHQLLDQRSWKIVETTLAIKECLDGSRSILQREFWDIYEGLQEDEMRIVDEFAEQNLKLKLVKIRDPSGPIRNSGDPVWVYVVVANDELTEKFLGILQSRRVRVPLKLRYQKRK